MLWITFLDSYLFKHWKKEMSLRSADHTDQLNLYTLATLLLISPSFPFLFNMFLIFPCKGKITCFPRVPFTHILSHFQHTDIQHICRELSICVCWDHDLLCYCNTNNRKGAQKAHHSYWQPIPSEAGSTAPQFSSLPSPLLYVTLAASPWGQRGGKSWSSPRLSWLPSDI